MPVTPLHISTSGNSSVPAIEAHDLVKTYPGGVRALDGFGFSVQTGSVYGLLGPNGAGKSTAIKILTTLSRPDSGNATVAGIDLLRHPDRVRSVIGCIAQKSGIDREATGRENLMLQGRLYGLPGTVIRQRAAELLERLHLTAAADKVARTYSGGMQRKLDIAMGLVHRPQVLFLDEPTTGLDPEARTDMWQEITRLAGEGLTILLTTHYLEEADRLTARLAIIDKGHVVVEGSPEDLKAELRGDAIQIELTPRDDGALPEETAIRTALDHAAGLREIRSEGKSLSARTDHGATAVPLVLAALESHGVKVAAVRVARPSLDDVYLRYTGRSFHEDNEETA